ncbi:MAG: CRISPR-associated endonuclease Cas1 [Pseudomonadota bacterium]|nr:CRISPR-associated endonuclease Cas1 [Pseudomonadota bacterium]
MLAVATKVGAASPRLPLYLYGQSPTQVSANGPALLVRITQKAPLRYPFARLARVIAGPRVEWQASALSACQHEGLPIVFLDGAGEPTGYLQPVQGKPSRLDSVIEEMLDRADWPMHYSHWLRAERMDRVQGWHRARLAAGREVDEDDFRELIRQHVYRPESESFLFTQSSPQAGALTAYSLQALHQAGLKTRYWGSHGDPLELAGDLTRLLSLALHLEMHGLGAGLHGDNAALLRVLHSFGPHIDQLLPHLLGSLHRRLKSLLEEWR